MEESASLLRSPDDRKARGHAVGVILLLNMVGWFTYYGVSQALKNFMEYKLGYSKITASSIRSTWASFGEVLPLLGAFVGDELWGRYTALNFSAAWMIGGSVVLAFVAHPYVLANYAVIANVCFILTIFGGVGVGIGCFHPNIVTFGADQFDTPADKELYFSHYYLTANLGSSISYASLAFLSVNGLGALVPTEYGYLATFLVSAVVMLLALVPFLAHRTNFRRLPPQPKAFTAVFSTIWGSVQACPELQYVVAGFAAFGVSYLLNVAAVVLPPNGVAGTALTWLSGGCVLLGMGSWIVHTWDVSYIDAHADLSPLLRNDLKQVLRMLLVACFLVMWQCVLDQMDANFQSIAQQCDLRLGPHRDSVQVPGAMLGIFDTLGVLAIAPLLSFFVYPKLEAWRGAPLSAFDKMSAGYVLAAITLFWTALVESWRRNSGEIDLGDGLGPVLDSGTHKPMNNLSWLYIAVSYLLASCCECLINIPSYELFYTQVPVHWKSTSQSMRSFLLAMGGNVASIFTLSFGRFIPDDLNQGNLEYMYYVMAAVAAVNAVGFIFVVKATNLAQVTTFHIDLVKL